MRNVHYFPRYSQKENVVTNNTLLLFLRLMEFSRRRFEEFLSRLAGDAELTFEPQWLSIGQQKRGNRSIPDGFIAQDSVKIIVETKLETRFGYDQLRRHLGAFGQEQHKLLILLSPVVLRPDSTFEGFCGEARTQGIEVLSTSFDLIAKVLRRTLTDRDDEMLSLLEDYVAFCQELELISAAQYTLFAPPCGPSHLDNEQLHLYYCPASRPVRAAKYLGIYARREIRAIGRIDKVVVCTIDTKAATVAIVEGKEITQQETERILQAARLAPKHGWDITSDHRFYLCDEWSAASFKKSSPKGIMGHRMIDLREQFSGTFPPTVQEMVEYLNGRTWT